jgi:hypothetical protein
MAQSSSRAELDRAACEAIDELDTCGARPNLDEYSISSVESFLDFLGGTPDGHLAEPELG